MFVERRGAGHTCVILVSRCPSEYSEEVALGMAEKVVLDVRPPCASCAHGPQSGESVRLDSPKGLLSTRRALLSSLGSLTLSDSTLSMSGQMPGPFLFLERE